MHKLPLLHTAAAAALLALLAASGTAQAVTSGGYSATASAFAWDELSPGYNNPVTGAHRVLGNDDDSATGAVGLGFGFTFFNQRFNQVFITSNGLLTFGRTTTDNNNRVGLTGDNGLGEALRFTTMPFIAVAWDDWTTTPGGTDGVYYKTAGAAGSRAFTVEWRNTQQYSLGSNPVSFEAVLHEGSDAIELRYLTMATGNLASASGASAVVGIRDVDAFSNGRYLQWSRNQAVLPGGTALTIAPVPEPQTWALLLAGLGMVVCLARRCGKRATL
jgi:hypothetical protein